jgi:tRNA(adenine34) deaminase
MDTQQEQDQHFMRLALGKATMAPAVGEVPIGAVLVHQGRLLASAHNLREGLQDPTAHAEMLVITAAAAQLKSWRLTDTTLYVTLEPCSMCMGAIINSRIMRLVFGARDPKAGACGSIFNIPAERRLNHQVEVTGGVLREDCQRILQTFFRQLRLQSPYVTRCTALD